MNFTISSKIILPYFKALKSFLDLYKVSGDEPKCQFVLSKNNLNLQCINEYIDINVIIPKSEDFVIEKTGECTVGLSELCQITLKSDKLKFELDKNNIKITSGKINFKLNLLEKDEDKVKKEKEQPEYTTLNYDIVKTIYDRLKFTPYNTINKDLYIKIFPHKERLVAIAQDNFFASMYRKKIDNLDANFSVFILSDLLKLIISYAEKTNVSIGIQESEMFIKFGNFEIITTSSQEETNIENVLKSFEEGIKGKPNNKIKIETKNILDNLRDAKSVKMSDTNADLKFDFKKEKSNVMKIIVKSSKGVASVNCKLKENLKLENDYSFVVDVDRFTEFLGLIENSECEIYDYKSSILLLNSTEKPNTFYYIPKLG